MNAKQRIPSYSHPPVYLRPASSELECLSSLLRLISSSHFSFVKPLSLFLSLGTSSPEFLPELANPPEILEEVDASNQRVVRALYEALGSRDVDTVHRLLAADLEWWFHGPPSDQFMMRLLTGVSSDESFVFKPLAIASFGPTVLAEGCDHSRSISWVHAWTVTDGVITQVREYFNTSLTVTRLSNSDFTTSPTSPISAASSTSSSSSRHCPSVWESSFSNQVGKSVPGLVLAI